MAMPSNVLILAITRFGDMLQASPTFVGLKQQYPGVKITVLVDKAVAQVCTGIPGIDDIIALELSMLVRCAHYGGEGITEAYYYVTKVVDDLREKNFDLVLNMSSSPYTSLLMKILDVPNSRGWIADEEGCRLITEPWAMLFAAFVYHSNRDYNSINLVDIMRCSVGVDQHPKKLVFKEFNEGEQFVEKFFQENNIPADAKIVALQAGASQEKRQWSPVYFARLLKILVEDMGLRVILTGTASELPIIEKIKENYNHQYIYSALGKTTIPQLSSLLKKTKLLITGDTGTMHLSVAVGVPVVAVFLASALCFETGPYSVGNIVLQPQIECGPCNPNFRCLKTDCHDYVSPELIAFLTKLRLDVALGEEDKIILPEKLRNQSKVAIYITTFDSDGFLLFKPLSGEGGKNGMDAKFYKVARASYRALWKEDFQKLEFKPLSQQIEKQFLADDLVEQGLRQTINLCEQGIENLEKLVYAANDPKIPPENLRQINQDIVETDKKIEEVGLSYPVLGALIRIFLMEKDNIRGEKVQQLASDTKELYVKLKRRSFRFGNLFKHFEKEISL